MFNYTTLMLWATKHCSQEYCGMGTCLPCAVKEWPIMVAIFVIASVGVLWFMTDDNCVVKANFRGGCQK